MILQQIQQKFLLITLILLFPRLAITQETFADLILEQTQDNVLRYVITFESNIPMRSFCVVYSGLDTLTTEVSPLQSVHRLHIIGLEPERSYDLRIFAFDEYGVDSTEVISFTTAALPMEVMDEVLELTGDSTLPGFYMTDSRILSSTQLRIINRQGKVVWYEFIDSPNAPCIGYNLNTDRTITYIYDNCSLIREIDLFGREKNVVNARLLDGDISLHHEVRKLDNGQYLILAAKPVDTDSLLLIDDCIYLLDQDGHHLWSWSLLDNLPHTTGIKNNVFWDQIYGERAADIFHSNALSTDSDSNYILSASQLNQVIKIDKSTGQILWALGGEDSDFEFAIDHVFAQQHTPVMTGQDSVLLFDNIGAVAVSRALEFSLDTVSGVAQTVFMHVSPTAILTPVLGSVERLANGHTAVFFAQRSKLEEVDASDSLVWSLTVPTSSYRAYYLDNLYEDVPEFNVDTLYLSQNSSLEIDHDFSPEGGYFTGEIIDNKGLLYENIPPGSYTIHYHYGWKKTEVPVVFRLASGLDPIVASGIHMYPNPSNNILRIEYPFAGNGAYTVVNIKGEVVLKQMIKTHHSEIDISSLNAGLYFMILENPQTVLRFIKK